MTRLRIRLSSRAAHQIERAAIWWRKHRDKAPTAFDEEIAEAFQVVRRNPGVGTLVQQHPRPRHHLFTGDAPAQSRVGVVAHAPRQSAVRVRRRHRRRIQIAPDHENGAIEIVGIWHASRGSRPRL